MNGNRADHYVNLSQVKLDYPLKGFPGLGVEYVLCIADCNYEDYQDVYARNPELRLYVIWKTD